MTDLSQPSSSSLELGVLPEWDLSDLYPDPASPQLQRDLDQIKTDAKDFADRWQGRLGESSAAALAEAITAYQALQEGLGRIASYGYLVYAGNVSDPEKGRFYQAMQEQITAISSLLLFFVLEINDLEEQALQEKLTDPALARWAAWLRDQRARRPYQLEEAVERVLHEKQITGRSAWRRLFDETMSRMRFDLDGKRLSETEILDKLTEADRSLRERAAKSFGAGLKEQENLFALITNTLARDKALEDEWRGFSRPVSARNLANLVEDEVVDALVDAVVEAYPRLSHRYYSLKARWLGLDKLAHWDRNAPLPESDDRRIPWEEARATVLDAYAAFSPQLAEEARPFFENAWIDAPARPGKASGAFAHPTVPSVHPYLLLNYQGRVRDVMTLAHELGHGVHQVLAGREQGLLLAGTPLTLAETASVFGEMLTFRSLLAQTEDPARRRVMLAGKVEDMLNTVVRQIAFHRFETRVHRARSGGELLPEELGDHWMETQREALGPAFELDRDYAIYWAYVPHFIHVPFYVYAYAFGDCLVNALYATYEQAHEGFAERYLELLAAGGSQRHRELLAPFGLNASDPAFWRRGLSVIEGLIDELEQLSE